MQRNKIKVSKIEKIISITSYFTMGIIGLSVIIIAYFFNQRLKPYLMYNIIQSVVISILLAILGFLFQFVMQIILQISSFSTFGISFAMFMEQRFSFLGLSFNVAEIIIILLLLYLSIGVLQNRLFNVPVLTRIVKFIMQFYK